jgi:hypothetical protein
MMRTAFTLAVSLLVAPIVCTNLTAQEVKAPLSHVYGARLGLDHDAGRAPGVDARTSASMTRLVLCPTCPSAAH